ncbi:hypothetical protein [Streptomyces sp. ISBFB 2968]|uniref:hypothetical protein n=1 Tax=Streptomyces sp. ISBFB 2968 TaxID=2903527 RepID=UPI002FDBF52A
MSGETAAIGIGFLAAGPVGAIVGGAALPVLVAASMWRARRREHDENANNDSNSSQSDGSKSGRDRSGSGGGSGRGRGSGSGGAGNGAGGRHRSPNSLGGGGRHKTPKSPGSGKGHGTGTGSGNNGLGGGGKNRKPKVKDPVADKLSKAGKGLADKFKNRDKNRRDKTGKDPKHGKDTAGTGTKDAKAAKDSKTPKTRKDHRGDYPDDRRWRGRGHKDKTPKTNTDRKNQKDRNRKDRGGDTTTATGRDGLAPITPTSGGTTADEIFDGELVDDDFPPKPDHAPDDVIDGEVIDEDRIALVKARRERNLRRQAIAAGKRAEKDAARDGTMGDPIKVKAERIRHENQRIDYELGQQEQMLALAASTAQRRSTPVNYPVPVSQAAGTTTGVAVARQIDVRGALSYRLLAAMAEQLAHGLRGDADADMADHVVELVAIPALCRNLSLAVREAANALQKTAPLHPSVIKHLNNAAVSALTAARMADTIIAVFVQAHRDDIYRVMAPRIGEDRWNIRNAGGTLDAAKLRAAILSSGQQRLALPAGGTNSSGGKLVPASGESTKKLVNLMKGFDRGHMVNCLSEVAGAAHGIDIVADSITHLYRRMTNTWPTETVVDDTVRATASKVKNVSAELHKAIKAAQRAHARELKLNAKPRKGALAEHKWDTVGRNGGQS